MDHNIFNSDEYAYHVILFRKSYFVNLMCISLDLMLWIWCKNQMIGKCFKIILDITMYGHVNLWKSHS